MRPLIAAALIGILGSSAAFGQAGRYQAQEECPQGREIRAKKSYPAAMTDCQVLDADTAKLRQPKVVAPKPPKAASPVVAAPTPAPAAPLATIPAPFPAATPAAPATPAIRTPPVRTDYERRIVGNWLTSAKEDRFGDGGTFTAATADGRVGLVVRCIQKELSIGMIDMGADQKPLKKGDVFELKFRVDTLPVAKAYGEAISDRLIQVVTEKGLVKSIRDGREVAVRIEDVRTVSQMHVFPLSGAPRAFADLTRECPLD